MWYISTMTPRIDSIFWIEIDKIKPNPYQPRREFNEGALRELAESIRQYGVLQPLIATRKEVEQPDGGLTSDYELIAGERRLRASKIAGLSQVPVVIRDDADNAQIKLELAIIENLQREDLNPIDRARAFAQLVNNFGFKHGQVGQKVGRSREYVSNSLRLLAMPEDIQQAIVEGKMTEGHARPILMLCDKPDEQRVLFKEILYKKLTVREAESISRRIATDKVRKKEYRLPPDIIELERILAENLGTRVQIEQREVGGKVVIDFDTHDALRELLDFLSGKDSATDMQDDLKNILEERSENSLDVAQDDESDDDLYSIKNFSI